MLNQQREVIYGIRNAAIHAPRPRDIIFEQIEEEVTARLEHAGVGGQGGASQTALESCLGWANGAFPIGLKLADLGGTDPVELAKTVVEKVKSAYAVKESVEIPEALGALERYVVINAIDHHWQEHLTEMENLRQSVGLRSYGQKDPLVEYKAEAYKYFEELMGGVRRQICTGLFRSASNLSVFENMLAVLSRTAKAVGPADIAPAAPPPPAAVAPEPEREITLPMPKPVPAARAFPKVGRNDPCPCGSGKKYKSCHGS